MLKLMHLKIHRINKWSRLLLNQWQTVSDIYLLIAKLLPLTPSCLIVHIIPNNLLILHAVRGKDKLCYFRGILKCARKWKIKSLILQRNRCWLHSPIETTKILVWHFLNPNNVLTPRNYIPKILMSTSG